MTVTTKADRHLWIVVTSASGNNRYSVWDSQNRLVKCINAPYGQPSTASTFTYGSDGLRRRGVVTTYAPFDLGNPIGGGGIHPLAHPAFATATPTQGPATGSTVTNYIYDGSMMVEQVVQHFDGSGSAIDTPTTITYMQGPQGPLYRKSSAVSDPSWYVYDGLGSVVGEVDVNGNLTASKEFDVYGLTRSVTGTPTTRQGFVGGLGHESDDETGLVYMQARYYDPGTGRFVSQDPAHHGSDWFLYCHDDPVNYFDKNGKDESLASIGTAMCAIGELFATFAADLGAIIAEGAEPFMVQGQTLVGDAQFVVRNLMADMGMQGGLDQFEMWAVRTMGGAGGDFIKAWITTNVEQEMALYYIDDEGTTVFASHATPYVGSLQGQ